MDELTCKRVKGTWNPRKGSCELKVPGWSPADDLLTADINESFENEHGDKLVIQGTGRGWDVNFISHTSQRKTPLSIKSVNTEEQAFEHAIDWMKKHPDGI